MTFMQGTTIFLLFVSGTFLGVLGSQVVARILTVRAIAKQQEKAMAAFKAAFGEAADEDCGDPNCEVHGTAAKQRAALEALKN